MTDTNGDDATKVPGTVVCNLTSTLDAMKTPSEGWTSKDPAIGLSATRLAFNEVGLAEIVTRLVGERFSMKQTQVTELGYDMSTYYRVNGIFYEVVLFIMTDYFIWPTTIPVTMWLSNIATYTEFVLRNLLKLKELNTRNYDHGTR